MPSIVSSSLCLACPDTWTWELRPWNTRASRRASPLSTRATAVSLPWMGVAAMITVSPGSSATHLWRPPAISDSAAYGSPWAPVLITIVCSGGIASSSSIGSTRSAPTSSTPSSMAMRVLRSIERPTNAT